MTGLRKCSEQVKHTHTHTNKKTTVQRPIAKIKDSVSVSGPDIT